MSLKYLWGFVLAALLCTGILSFETATYVVAQTTTTTTPSSGIDLSPIIGNVISIVGAVLGGVAIWVGVWVKSWVEKKVDLSKTQLDEQIQQRFNEAALRAIAYAESVVKGKIPTNIDTGSDFINTAGGYLTRMFPNLVGNMTPEQIRDAIISRLPSPTADKAQELVVAKASGTTPAT